MLYVSYPKGATDQFVIYHLKFIFYKKFVFVLFLFLFIYLSSKGIEPFTALTNSFTENHHYQSDHLPLFIIILKFYLYNNLIMNSEVYYLIIIIHDKNKTKTKINKYILRIESTWTWTRTFSLKGRHSTTQVLLS